MNIFKQRIVYFVVLTISVGMIIFHSIFYCKPTVSYEPINDIKASRFLGSDTMADVITMDNQEVSADLSYSVDNNNISVEKANKLTHMYVFRGKNNEAFSVSASKASALSQKKINSIGWIISNIGMVIILFVLGVLLNVMIPGKQIIFNKKQMIVTF